MLQSPRKKIKSEPQTLHLQTKRSIQKNKETPLSKTDFHPRYGTHSASTSTTFSHFRLLENLRDLISLHSLSFFYLSDLEWFS